MTVLSLWKVLEDTGCGTPVGLYDFTEDNKYQPKSLAIDLSIWICEGLSSTALASFHSEPALYLVYQRTIKLLKIGIKLIFVMEGKKRRLLTEDDRVVHTNTTKLQQQQESNENPQTTHLYNRRSGTKFWSACERCQKLLHLLGVTALQAQAEGEALCALLNERGLVDGVISNDGDCFLYGAKILYTRFSVENLERGQVLRYDASHLKAYANPDPQNSNGTVEEDDVTQNDFPVDGRFYPARNIDKVEEHVTTPVLCLSREDLVAFALLTGSDLVGNGVPSIGYKKALRFISICKKEPHGTNVDTAALNQLQLWGKIVQESDTDKHLIADNKQVKRCCTICHHPGNKKSHKDHGCSLCGTKPGEECTAKIPSDNFFESIRAKVTSMQPPFLTGLSAALEYFRPNSGCSAGISKNSTILHTHPRLNDFLNSSILVMGRTLDTSREHIRHTLPKLIIRSMIIKESQRKGPRNRYVNSGGHNSDGSIIKPEQIINEKSHKLILCYEMRWSVNGSNYITFEWQSIINDLYPQLVERYNMDKRHQDQQTNQDLSRRHLFGRQINQRKSSQRRYPQIKQRVKRSSRTRHFNGINEQTKKKRNDDYHINKHGQGDDATALMKYVSGTHLPIVGMITRECNDCSSINRFDEYDASKITGTNILSPLALDEGEYSGKGVCETPGIPACDNRFNRREQLNLHRNGIDKSIVLMDNCIKFSPLRRKRKQSSAKPS